LTEVESQPLVRRHHWRALVRGRRLIWDRDFQLQVIALALAHWERLDPDDQSRFADLVRRNGDASDSLSMEERVELARLLKRLEIKPLIRLIISMAADYRAG